MFKRFAINFYRTFPSQDPYGQDSAKVQGSDNLSSFNPQLKLGRSSLISNHQSLITVFMGLVMWLAVGVQNFEPLLAQGGDIPCGQKLMAELTRIGAIL